MNDYPLKQNVTVSLDAPMGQMRSHEVAPFAAGALDAANAGRARAMGQLEADYIKMSDYKAGAKGERDLDGLRDEYEQRIQRGLEAAPGSAESLFLEDGTRDEDKIAALQSEMQEAFTAVEPRFLSPQAEVRWQENKAGYLQNVENRINGQVAGHELRSIRQAFEERHEAMVQRGDIPGALRNLKDAEDAGIISGNKAATERFRLEQDELMRQVGTACMAPGHADFLRLYDDPEFRSKLSYENLMKLDAMAGRLQTQPRSTAKSAGTAADGSPKAKNVVEPPYGLPSYALGFWNKYNGDFKNNPQAQQEAIDVVHKLARGIITQANDPAEVELLKQRAELFGVSKEYAGNVAAQIQKELAGDADYKPGDAVDGLGELAFLTPVEAADVGSWREELRRLQEDGSDEERQKVLQKDIKEWETYAKEEVKKAKRDISSKFDAWCMAHPEATYQEKVEKYWDFVQDYRATKDYRTDVRKSSVFRREREAAGIYADALEERRQLASDEHDAYMQDVEATNEAQKKSREAQGEQDEYDTKMEAAAMLDDMGALGVSTDPTAARSFEGNETERILYVPAASGLQDGQTIVVTTPGDVAAEATVRVQEGIGSAVMSQKLRYTLGCVRLDYNSLSFVGGEARLGVTDGAAGGQGLDAASLIYRSEARVDKYGRLKVYTPPAGDGGGAYEVAGINAASHPQEAAKLRLMVQNGQHAAAESEAKRYIKEYTQPVADFLEKAGVKSKGVDYYLRDIYMNGGAGGAAKVLNRAVGASGGKLTDETKTKLQEFLGTHSERELLLKLRDVRLQWYKGISAANPAKQKFMRGWANRTSQAYKSALSLA